MARPYVIIALAVMIPGFAASAFAQAGASPTPAPSGVEMGTYYLIQTAHGPNWKALTDEENSKANLDLIEDLKAALGSEQVSIGGAGNEASVEKIVAIVRSGNEMEMREALQGIRSVADGLFRLRIQPWYAPASTWTEVAGSADGC